MTVGQGVNASLISILSVRSVKSGVKIKTGAIRPSDQVVKGAAAGVGMRESSN